MKITLKDANKYYSNGGHDINHIKRVYKNCLKISKTVKCDTEVIKAAAILHDIARWKEDKNSNLCHASEGARMAQKILINYDYTSEQVNKITHAIQTHRVSRGIKPETIEDKILQDADRLDALGAIVIARMFIEAGRKNKTIHDPRIKPSKTYDSNTKDTTVINHFFEKILKLKPETFNTTKGKQLAKHRYEYVKEFVTEFLNEWNSKI